MKLLTMLTGADVLAGGMAQFNKSTKVLALFALGFVASLARAAGPGLPASPEAQAFTLQSLAEGRFGGLLTDHKMMRPTDPAGAALDFSVNYPNITVTPERENQYKDNDACSQAYAQLSEHVSAADSVTGLSGRVTLSNLVSWYVGASEAERGTAKNIIKAMENYAAACLTKDLPNYLSKKQLDLAIGVIGYGEEGGICTGLRFAKDKVLTARHCFYSNDGKLDSIRVNGELQALNPQKIWFQYKGSAGPEAKYYAKQLDPESSGSLATMSNDYVVVTIQDTPDPAPKLTYSDEIVPGSAIFLEGYYPLAKTDASDLQLRSTSAKGCRATPDNGCIFHGCQSLQGMSGAPIILVPNKLPKNGVPDSLTIVGLHLGANDEDTRLANQCNSLTSTSNTSNIGYSLPKIPPFYITNNHVGALP